MEKNGINGCPFNGIKIPEFDMSDFQRPDNKTRCTWKLGTTEPTVHTVRPL